MNLLRPYKASAFKRAFSILRSSAGVASLQRTPSNREFFNVPTLQLSGERGSVWSKTLEGVNGKHPESMCLAQAEASVGGCFLLQWSSARLLLTSVFQYRFYITRRYFCFLSHCVFHRAKLSPTSIRCQNVLFKTRSEAFNSSHCRKIYQNKSNLIQKITFNELEVGMSSMKFPSDFLEVIPLTSDIKT